MEEIWCSDGSMGRASCRRDCVRGRGGEDVGCTLGWRQAPGLSVWAQEGSSAGRVDQGLLEGLHPLSRRLLTIFPGIAKDMACEGERGHCSPRLSVVFCGGTSLRIKNPAYFFLVGRVGGPDGVNKRQLGNCIGDDFKKS